ncbi:NAD-dependent protein deacylase [uncultured archaeon]|nr:NAD-dependent protein deacylase [uncultured archaeon]
MEEQKPNEETSKVVCFFGAGASAWAGIPTFNDFQKKAEIVCDKLPEHSPEKKVFQCVLKDWRTRYKDSNIEEYYATIEMHETLNFNNIKKEDSDCITSAKVVTVICNTIQESINSKTSKIPYYFDLIWKLQDGSTDLVFITTNWDILFESTKRSYLRDGWINYGEGIFAYNASNQTNPTEIFKILKLHGSLNWGICKNCENRNIYYTEKMWNVLISSSLGLKCPKCGNKLEPVIVPPTISKLTKANYFQLKSIWSSAHENLRSCEKIYFIGYSFPETDVETKYFISDALKSNTNLKEIIIITDQKYGRYKVDFEERYLSIISKINSKPKFKFVDDGFESFCLQDSPRMK